LAAAEAKDVEALRQLANEEGGLETNDLRRIAWFVGCLSPFSCERLTYKLAQADLASL
jgi:hypothetical protein